MTNRKSNIDPREIALRIAEATCNIRRKPGADPEVALDEIEAVSHDVALRCMQAALSVVEYLRDQAVAAKRRH